jgi:DNA-binding Lrp family transcriptional regulator
MHPDKIPKLLYELIKNSRRSDRDLAKVLGFSQPTVTRTRRKLEDDQYVRQYTAIPDFTKLGFELTAFTFTQWSPGEGRAEAAYKWLETDPRVIFVAEGSGLDGKHAVIMTMHKNYADYSDFVIELRQKAAVESSVPFLAALANVRKHLNFASLQDV